MMALTTSPNQLLNTTHAADNRKQNWAVAKSRLDTAEYIIWPMPFHPNTTSTTMEPESRPPSCMQSEVE